MSSIQFSDWIMALLQTIKANAVPPPKASRWFFLACSLAWDALQYSSDSSFNIIDAPFQTSGKGTRLSSNILISFIINAVHQSWTLLFNTYAKFPTTFIDSVWTIQYPLLNSYPSLTPILEQWMQRASVYLASRDNDGSKTSGIAPGPIINNGYSIISSGYSSPGVIQDLSNLPDIQKWTPLSTNGVVQKYLTPGWGNVSPIVNISSQTDDIGNKFFPTIAKHDIETKDVLNISENLTDQQKMIAELWTGGGNTVTPPGMFLFFATKLAQYKKFDIISEISMFKYLTASLFQASISAWYLKWKYQQSRPIQNIRISYKGTQGNNWTSPTSIDLGIWKPYQDNYGINTLTPPHPDFVSGHSTFSASASRVLNLYLGTSEVPTVQFSSEDLLLLSPIFAPNIGKAYANLYMCYPGCSDHQPGVVPNSGVTLSFNSWDEMANSAGISRIYGGIHVEASNQGGLALGRIIGDEIFANL